MFLQFKYLSHFILIHNYIMVTSLLKYKLSELHKHDFQIKF
jgi:hypothetical protein